MKKQLRITVEGKTYEVEVEVVGGPEMPSAPASGGAVRSASVAAPAAAPQKPAPAPSADGAVPSPFAATVVSIDVKVGQEVAAGDKLVTLDAMKMNTYVNAPRAGTVKEIHVAPADAVEEGQALVTLD
ncbi:MAG: biotin/lipoyl-containing protein [Opitutales bacterium]